jgi:hypothetical protein
VLNRTFKEEVKITDNQFKNMRLTTDGACLAAAMVAGLIDKSEHGYDDEQIRALLSALRAHTHQELRLNREQMEALKNYTQCSYFVCEYNTSDTFLSNVPVKKCRSQSYHGYNECRYRNISIGSLFVCVLCLLLTVILKFG